MCQQETDPGDPRVPDLILSRQHVVIEEPIPDDVEARDKLGQNPGPLVGGDGPGMVPDSGGHQLLKVLDSGQDPIVPSVVPLQ